MKSIQTITGAGDAPPRWADAEAIRNATAEVLARPEFELERGIDKPNVDWLLELAEWLFAPFKWLFQTLEGLPSFIQWLVVLFLFASLLAIFANIIWSLLTLLKPSRRTNYSASAIQDTVVDPYLIEQESRRLAKEEDYVGACRRLLQAVLLHLQAAREKKFRPGVTNYELLREFRTSPVIEPLKQLVATVDSKWYGDEPCYAEDYRQCVESHSQILRLVQERSYAVGA